MGFAILLALLLACIRAGFGGYSNDLVGYYTEMLIPKLEECEKQLFPGSGLFNEFKKFFILDHPFVDQNLGCLMVCGMYKINVLHENGSLDEGVLRHLLNLEPDPRYSYGASTTKESLINTFRTCFQTPTNNTSICAAGYNHITCLRPILTKPEWHPGEYYTLQ